MPNSWQVDYFTALGIDMYSDRIVAFLEGNGIGSSHIRQIEDRRPGLYMIHQADGDRHFTYWRGQSAAKLLADDASALKAGLVGADLIYFSGITLAILAPDARARLLAKIGSVRKKGKVRVAFDPNIRPALWTSPSEARSAISEAAAVSDILLPTFSDDAQLFGDASTDATADRYLALGPEQVIVKDGASKALIADRDHRFGMAPKHGIEAVDATGAGDSFNGAYLAALLRGDSVFDAVRQAHDTAGRVIGHRGALMPMSILKPDPEWKFIKRRLADEDEQ